MMSDSEVLKELRNISKLLLLANSASVQKELDKVASTDDKKKMWVLMDGKRMPKDIANDAKVGERSVNYFLAAATAAEIVEYTKGKPPHRSVNYVPPSWIELVKLPESNDENIVVTNQSILDNQKGQVSPSDTQAATGAD